MADSLIAVANHDPVLMRLLEQVLVDAGFETIQLNAGANAYLEIKERRPDLVILDTWLENREAGWVLIQALRLDKETRTSPSLSVALTSMSTKSERRLLRTTPISASSTSRSTSTCW